MSKSIKLVTVGAGGVGKTCALISYATNCFPSEYVPTVFDNFSTSVLFEDQMVQLGMWDTAGQEEYDRLRPLSYPSTDVFLVMFDVTSRASFNTAISKFVSEVQLFCSNTPMLLVGNKNDLDQREVSKEEAERTSRSKGFVGYYEISAKTQSGLKNLFLEAIRAGLSKSGIKNNDTESDSGSESGSDTASEPEEQDEYTKQSKEEEDLSPATYKFGLYLIDKYSSKVEEKHILKKKISSLWRLKVEIVKYLKTTKGTEIQDDEVELVRDFLEDNGMTIYIHDPDFDDFFQLTSYDMLTEVGQKTNNIVKLQLSSNW